MNARGFLYHTTTMVMTNCTVCGKEFRVYPRTLKRVKNPTCSRQCNGVRRGQEWAKHGHKGRAAWTEESHRSYQLKMLGPNNPAWKGGVTFKKSKGNYIGPKYVRCPKEYLPMARKDGYIMEHRLVMAMHLGRLLARTEVVHHKDHNTRNNLIDNLQLFSSNGEHKRAEGVEGRGFRKG